MCITFGLFWSPVLHSFANEFALALLDTLGVSMKHSFLLRCDPYMILDLAQCATCHLQLA